MQLLHCVRQTFFIFMLTLLCSCGGSAALTSPEANTQGNTAGSAAGNAGHFKDAAESNTPASSSSAKLSQTLSFSKATIEVDGQTAASKTVINRVNATGSGAISYKSSDPDLATVTSEGIVTLHPNGKSNSVTITATIAGDEHFQATSASYSITMPVANISLAPVDITMSAWVGETNALIYFPAEANGFTFYSSNDRDCDFSHVANCMNGQFTLLNGSQLRNTALTLEQSGNHLLQDGNNHSSFRLINQASFAPRTEHQVVNFNSALWLVGGHLGLINFWEPDFRSDVWSSLDGISWSEQTSNAGFSTRVGERVAVFNNSLWLVGGNDWKVDYLIPGEDNGRKNDVWSSADGLHWTQQIAHAGFSPRMDHALVNFNNKLWVIGGNDKNGNKNDIWSSPNGITWIKHTDNAGFPARSNPQIIAFNNKLWLIGTSGKDVWASADGINWAQQTLNTSFSAREEHKVVVHNGRLWLIAGYDKNDVWSSADGLTWVQQTEHAAFSPRNNFQLVSFDDKLIISGGSTKEGFSNETWSSSDGIEWRRGFAGTFQFRQ